MSATPGPWQVITKDSGAIAVCGPQFERIAEVAHARPFNANLIAAAPDLLAAASAALTWCEPIMKGFGVEASAAWDAVVLPLRAAIAKAGGVE